MNWITRYRREQRIERKLKRIKLYEKLQERTCIMIRECSSNTTELQKEFARLNKLILKEVKS